jgi:2-dehydro-3-deoxyphosphogluconate aldolase/(4S)-4-hydroxy-2-oxoglutarate aldolase
VRDEEIEASPVLSFLASARIVPVVVIDDASAAVDLVDALHAGGIRCAEFTLRTDAGLAAIAAAAGRPGFAVGAGTVLSLTEVDACVDAGAEFIVSPGFDEDVVERTRQRGALPLPGTATATEIQRAHRAGLRAVKFFPADRLGGLPTLAALSAPFPAMRFLPSGGIGPAEAGSYLAHPTVFAVGGSWMVPRTAIAQRDFETIERLSRAAVALTGTAP